MSIREGIKKIIKESLDEQFAKGTTENGTYIYYSEPIADQIITYLKSQRVVRLTSIKLTKEQQQVLGYLYYPGTTFTAVEELE